MELAQTRSAVVAEGTRGAPAGRSERVFQVPVRDNAAVVVIHRPKIYHWAANGVLPSGRGGRRGYIQDLPDPTAQI
jgi:hypothetical protein